MNEAVPARNSAAVEVVMMITVSLRLIDMSLNQCKLRFPSFANVFRELQQLRADLQSGALGRIQIDVESNLVVFDDKTDHAPGSREFVALTHGQHRRALEQSEHPLRAGLLRWAHRQDMAGFLPLKLPSALLPEGRE